MKYLLWFLVMLFLWFINTKCTVSGFMNQGKSEKALFWVRTITFWLAVLITGAL